MKKIRVIVADDHTILRQGLVDILSRYGEIDVIAEAENGEQIVSLYEQMNPDLVLTDIEMPVLSGLLAAKKVLRDCPDAKFLFLSMYYNEDYIYKVDSIGGFGLLSKEIIKDELVKAIKLVYKGEKYFHNKSADEINDIRIRNNELNNASAPKSLFTPREKSILQQIAEGKSSEQIAVSLNLSKRTIDACRSAIMSKVHINSLAQLIKYAIDYSSTPENG